MKITVKAKPNSKRVYIKKLGEAKYEVAVKEVPDKGKANEAVLKSIAKHFGISKMRIKIKSGKTSKLKILEIQ